MCSYHTNQWFKWLSQAKWWYNTSFYTSLQTTPFEALYGMAPPIHVPYFPRDSFVREVDQLLSTQEEFIGILKDNLRKVQHFMKVQADKNRSKRSFQVGDWVFVKLQSYQQSSVQQMVSNKLSPRYYGPFLVLEQCRLVDYRLDLSTAPKSIQSSMSPPSRRLQVLLQQRFTYLPFLLPKFQWLFSLDKWLRGVSSLLPSSSSNGLILLQRKPHGNFCMTSNFVSLTLRTRFSMGGDLICVKINKAQLLETKVGGCLCNIRFFLLLKIRLIWREITTQFLSR